MTINTVTKVAPKAGVEVGGLLTVTTAERIKQLTDEVGTLNAQVKEIEDNPVFKQYAVARAELLGLLDDTYDADEAVELVGDEYHLKVWAKGVKREITDIGRVFELMGQDTFTEVCSVPMKAVDDYLTPPQQEEVVTSERVGARRLKFEKV